MSSSFGPKPATEIVQRLCQGTNYKPVRFLGRGGTGQVWVVQQKHLRREFALKILHPRFGTKPGVIDRLRFEAQATARIDHPGIVQVIDFWMNDDGHACFVMELLTGRSLFDEMDERKQLPILDVLDIGCQALSALNAAHAVGIIHRDIKPENLFLHHLPGQARIVKLLDFGLARAVTDFGEPVVEPPMQKTRTGATIGSPRYLSPEAARGEPVDQRSDIYSVGITLYEALTGRGPFDTFCVGPIVAPSALVQGVMPSLDDHIRKAIDRDPSGRFQTAGEFESALRSLLPNWHQRNARRPVEFPQ